MTVNQRVIEFMELKKIKENVFYKSIGISRQVFSSIKDDKNRPSFDVLQKILTTYPEINAKWLITGEGEMIIGENNITNNIVQMNQVDKISTQTNHVTHSEKEWELMNMLMSEKERQIEELRVERDRFRSKTQKLKAKIHEGTSKKYAE